MSDNDRTQLIDEAQRVVSQAKQELQRLREEDIAKTQELVQHWESVGYLVQAAGGFFARHPATMITLLYAQVGVAGVVYGWSLFGEFGLSIGVFTSASDFLLAAFTHPLAFGIAFALVTLQGVAVFHATVTQRRVSQATLKLSRTLQESVQRHTDAIQTVSERVKEALGDSMPKAVDELQANMQKLSMQAKWFEKMEETSREIANRTERRLKWWWGVVVVLGVTVTFIAPYALGWLDATRIKQGAAPRLIVEYTDRGEQANALGLSREVSVIGTSEKFTFFYDPARRQVLIIPLPNIAGVYYVHLEPATAVPSAAPDATGTPAVTAIAR